MSDSHLDKIIVKGARVHNLKNVDLEIPRDSLVVFTGVSGSGKSSLAFDTIYAEGQRRFMETLSAYARQFIGGIERPDVDKIEGLSPSISIEQKTISQNPRSTVGTVTEIYDFLRLLFARCGTQYSPESGKAVTRQNLDQIIYNVMDRPEGTRIIILAPVVRGRKGHYRELFEDIASQGFTKVRIDGEIKEITPGLKLERFKIHDIEIVIDRVEISVNARGRISESIEAALRHGEGVVIINDGKEDKFYNERLSDIESGRSFSEPAPNSFSFNSPYGWCKDCFGLGEKKDIDIDKIIPDRKLSVNEGAFEPLGKPRSTWIYSIFKGLIESEGYDFNTPVDKIKDESLDKILYGTSDKIRYDHINSQGRTNKYAHRFEGILNYVKRYSDDTSSETIRQWAEGFMTISPCKTCNGGRLKTDSLWVKINGMNIHDLTTLSIKKCRDFFENLELDDRKKLIASQIVKEIISRLDFLLNVGLEYLTLDRSARTLSGGEAQRIRLATQIGSQLTGVLYILDEPSIGLHQRDNIRLIDSLKTLRDTGNSVIVVEHDKEMIEASDYVFDLGPGAGEHGGKIVSYGPPKNLNGSSLTGDYISGKRSIDVPVKRREGTGNKITLTGAAGNNLKNVDLEIPLGKFICVTGVSGSGKSSLINETLYRILSKKFYKTPETPLPFKTIEGLSMKKEKYREKIIDKIIEIDQTPIGRTPRSNPATYTGLFTFIRDIFSNLPDSKIRGYKPGRFSFNVKGGRCDSCEGAGLQKIEMNFLPDVYVECEVCQGKRYNRETLEVKYKNKSIADVLGMTVEEAVDFFESVPSLNRKLRTLYDVGLGYIRLGQQATTLSGGEAQRVKLSTELSKVQTGRTLYILDEPTTGLHFEDINMLLKVLNKLTDKGNTVIVIEHNFDVIKTADWIIDMGPEGGEAGGKIIAEGTPEDLVKNYYDVSYTAKYLKDELK
ncbi:MAG TPA: excinuclease ABC subunit UvrA [Ignavibacteria bacterium]|nr:excinuclease ABC subunit UvrA [Bacteroidota bacterium]HRI85356.1 excinuclease ABC subunit UvrA [Ignavibacteria bacterium]HRK00755.1 excinuclease ABC subunit UvrA [Ignavibacteria bacterium]